MGLDEDLVAAGTQFIENNKDAYKEALQNINDYKEAKKERKESKTNKNVNAIEKLALQTEKEMQNKLK